MFRNRRPLTPYITIFVVKISLYLLSIPIKRFGTPFEGSGALVANHSSWLDIFALNSGHRLYFVSKSEVAKWPGIGLLAKATGTLFIRRGQKKPLLRKNYLNKN